MVKDLDKYKWKLRILLVETPSYDHIKYKDAKRLYKINLKEFHERFLKMVTKLTDSDFKIKLIGFDGTVKETYDKMNPQKIISAIDAMPMGHLRNQGKIEPLNLSLYADYNPETTIEGLGYKDREKAEYTLKKIRGEPMRYQMNVVNTMIGRAKNHPHRTKGMEEAIKIFEKWKRDNIDQSGGNFYYEEYLKLREIYSDLKHRLN